MSVTGTDPDEPIMLMRWFSKWAAAQRIQNSSHASTKTAHTHHRKQGCLRGYSVRCVFIYSTISVLVKSEIRRSKEKSLAKKQRLKLRCCHVAAERRHLVAELVPARPCALMPFLCLSSSQQRKGGPTRLTLPSKSTVSLPPRLRRLNLSTRHHQGRSQGHWGHGSKPQPPPLHRQLWPGNKKPSVRSLYSFSYRFGLCFTSLPSCLNAVYVLL